jgi:transposase-like protein
MKVHANAALGPKGRLTMARRVVEQGWSVTEAAAAAGVSDRTCSTWVVRYRCEREAGLVDRSSAPQTVANRSDELHTSRASPARSCLPGRCAGFRAGGQRSRSSSIPVVRPSTHETLAPGERSSAPVRTRHDERNVELHC